jgi:hypothetical protein
MGWLVPVLLLALLGVFGAAAFAMISGQQAGERAARATATAEAQAASSRATGTAVTRRRTATARANANATGTAEALVLVSEQSTATALALATQTTTTADSTARSAKIEKVEVEHNLFNDDDVKGMEIYVSFTTENLKGVSLPVNVYFSWANGLSITSLDGTYETPDRNVAVRRDAVPEYDSTEFTNFTIFMPYHELEMDFAKGTYDLRFQVVIYDDDLKELARSEYIPFTYTSLGPGN